MLHYNARLKENSRVLRQKQTDCERLLWSKLRRKQVGGVQFYRQKPIGSFIVDFFSPKAKLVIELDGSQHFETSQAAYDARRDAFLQKQGLTVLRFNNAQILKETRGVLEVIYCTVTAKIGLQAFNKHQHASKLDKSQIIFWIKVPTSNDPSKVL